MAADDEAQDAVRRILKERPPEDLPLGSEARLRLRLDEERPARGKTRPGPYAPRPQDGSKQDAEVRPLTVGSRVRALQSFAIS